MENNEMSVGDALKKFNANKMSGNTDYITAMNRETDPDLITSYEAIKLPSKGFFYPDGLSEVNIEYMTSKDEDLLTTSSLIENGTVLELLLKRKVKTPNVNTNNLLQGDRDALILFLRTSSYGPDYTVMITDPRNGVPFKTTINLLTLKYKEGLEEPDQDGLFKAFIPMRKKEVKFRLLTYAEDSTINKKADALKDAYGEEFSSYNTMRLKASIVSIGGNINREYIDKFVDAMPALDPYTVRKKILEVSPGLDLNYEFLANDGYTFKANLTLGMDFFFPST
jgi:hypothetical protein